MTYLLANFESSCIVLSRQYIPAQGEGRGRVERAKPSPSHHFHAISILKWRLSAPLAPLGPTRSSARRDPLTSAAVGVSELKNAMRFDATLDFRSIRSTRDYMYTVSYTHLTLPTKRIV